MWEAAGKVGNLFAIGVKTPGTRRGIYRAQRLVDENTWLQARQILGSRSGVEVYRVDDILPLIKVKITTYSTFAAVRRLAFVDYIEPALIAATQLHLASESGCDWPGHGSPLGVFDSYGDFIPKTYADSRVNWAWYYAPQAGAGITIGLVDTGVDRNIYQLGTAFTYGQSGGRWFSQTSSIGGTTVTCSHGSRMAGVTSGPRDGYGAVGVAYKANLYSEVVPVF